uniref:TAZ-type domain-containing protein n=1 Tax=Steinernema glaseri TaxID=37863 RepID=A0A1I8AQF1_9BILA
MPPFRDANTRPYRSPIRPVQRRVPRNIPAWFRRLVEHAAVCRLENCESANSEACVALRRGFRHYEACVARQTQDCFLCTSMRLAISAHIEHCSDRPNCSLRTCRNGAVPSQ